MADPSKPPSPSENAPDPFPDTRWSLVVRASKKDTPAAERALGELCSAYWYPVYGYFRGRGESPTDAEDLTQEFLMSLIRRESFDAVAPERGKLRAFLLAAAKNFLTSAHRKNKAQKRGGGAVAISIDVGLAEDQLALDPADPAAGPDVQFDRAWARTLIGRVRQSLEESYLGAGKAGLGNALLPYLEEDAGDPPYRELSKELGMSAGSLRVALFRMRQKYRTLLKREIADTLADDSELEDEIDQLVALFQN